jgi:ferredoxin
MMRVHVDMEKCIGSGMCTGFAPDVFELDDAGTLRLLAETVPAHAEPAVGDAVACCPVEAISVS